MCIDITNFISYELIDTFSVERIGFAHNAQADDINRKTEIDSGNRWLMFGHVT